MTPNIQSRFTQVEEEFVNSFSEGSSSLESFEVSWTKLVETLDFPSLDADTARVAYVAASRVEALASDLLELYSESVACKTSLLTEVESLFENLTLNDICTGAPSSPIQTNPSSQYSGCPPYIASAFKWLLKNTHNPYPSKETKLLISQATKTSVQNVDAWFLNARRRIGWTALSKRLFSGSKSDTVSAAYRALVKDDCAGGEEPLSADIRMAFVQMEVAAKELYSDKFTKSALAGKLDGMVKDMTDDDRRRRKAERATEKDALKRNRELERATKRIQGEDLKWKEARASLLSPFPTQATPSPPLSERKRRSSEDYGVDGADSESLVSRSTKRTRKLSSTASACSLSSSSSSTEISSSTYLSRASSCTLSLPDETPLTPPPTIDTRTLPAPGIPRKRRLSETAAEPPLKRQALVRPRLQVVSAPLPKLIHSDVFLSTPSSSASSAAPSPLFEVASVPNSEWSSLFFDTPGTAVLDELDLSALREPQFSCIAETAALLNGGNRGLDAFMSKGSDPSTIHSDLLDMSSYDQSDPLFGLSQSDPNIPWLYDDMTQLLSVQPPIATSSPCKLHAQSDHAHGILASLDDFSSLSSLPMNQVSSETTSTLNSTEHIDWLSIIPQPLPSNDFTSNTAFINTIDEASPVRTASDIVNVPVPLSTTKSTLTPISITSETRAEKYRQYRALISKAKQLEVELGQV